MDKLRSRRGHASRTGTNFYAEAAYADSIFRTVLGDAEGAVSALKRALDLKPTYAPAILSMGSVEYQRGRKAEGRRLFESLLSLPENTPDLYEIIDEAGEFLIQLRAYTDGLALYRAAAVRFPAVAAFHDGLGCCAGHEGLHDEAVAASERALDLEPGSQKFVNDLGWTLFVAGRPEEAETMLERAVSMDRSDELARENLRICRAKLGRRGRRCQA
jgi:Flp pilus assembly protein TadD